MNYFKEGKEYDAVENTVYRVYGGDVELEGGYVTDCLPDNANPIQMREDLALSQDSFYNEDGDLVRNLASEVATCTIYTTEDNEIINLDGELTGEHLEWRTVESVGELEGGGNEFKLPDDFDNIVEVESTDPLQHHSTPGWEAYIEAEAEVLEKVDEEPYEVDEEPYEVDEEPYEVDEEPYEVDEEPYEVDEEPYEVDEEPYEVYEEPYEVDEEPYEVDEEPYEVDEEPYEVDEEPYEVDEEPYEVDEEPYEVDEEPYEVDEEPYEVYEEPYEVDEEPYEVDEEPYEVDEEPYEVDEE